MHFTKQEAIEIAHLDHRLSYSCPFQWTTVLPMPLESEKCELCSETIPIAYGRKKQLTLPQATTDWLEMGERVVSSFQYPSMLYVKKENG